MSPRVQRSTLFPYTTLFRSFSVGENGSCRIVIGIGGRGTLLHNHAALPIQKGDVLLLPAAVGPCECWPEGAMVRSEEHTSELQSRGHLVCRLLLENQNLYKT